MMKRFLTISTMLLVSWLGLVGSANTCPFCTMSGQTLSGDLKQASLVLYGTLKDAKPNLSGVGSSDGTTTLEIDAVIKDHDILTNKKVVQLKRYLPPPDGDEYKFLVFCDVYKGRIDPFRGISVKTNSDMPKYLQGALKLKDASTPERLTFFFDYLANDDLEIQTDAYKEFGNASYEDFRKMAKSLPADVVVGWLQDPETPSYRLGLYGSMLGHCGQTSHAAVLRGLLDDPKRRLTSGIDGILAAYTLLTPKEGWSYIRNILGDANEKFLKRYAALRATRFFWNNRPDIVSKEDVTDAVCLLLEQKDIADLAIEDLRKWECWDEAPHIFALQEKEPYKVSIVRRSILRYALASEDKVDLSAKYVEAQREKDPQAVEDAKEILALEKPTETPEPDQKDGQ